MVDHPWFYMFYNLKHSNIYQSRLLTLGIVLCLVSESSLGLWVGLEMNMFSLLPLLVDRGTRPLQYFVAQVLGTLFFLLGVSQPLFGFMVVLGFCVKIGVLPYFAWYVELLPLVRVNLFCLMATLQKFHFFLLLNLKLNKGVSALWVMASLTLIFMSVLVIRKLGGSNKVSWYNLKKVLAHLSVLDGALLLFLFWCNPQIGIWYFFLYSRLLVIFMFSLKIKVKTKTSIMMTLVRGLSLSGFPPFPGFFIKVGLIKELLRWNVERRWGFTSLLLLPVVAAVLIQFLCYVAVIVRVLFNRQVRRTLNSRSLRLTTVALRVVVFSWALF